LLRQPTRHLPIVFASKTGKRLSAPTLTGYWAQVKAAAGLDFDFYMVTKHLSVHRLYGLGLSARAIATQMGWAEGAVESCCGFMGTRSMWRCGKSTRFMTIPDAFPTQRTRNTARRAELCQSPRPLNGARTAPQSPARWDGDPRQGRHAGRCEQSVTQL
jgi:hypothetical protein